MLAFKTGFMPYALPGLIPVVLSILVIRRPLCC